MSKAACKVLICRLPVDSASDMPETKAVLDAIETAARELGPGWTGYESPWFDIAAELEAQTAKIKAFDRRCANALKAKLMAVLPVQVDE